MFETNRRLRERVVDVGEGGSFSGWLVGWLAGWPVGSLSGSLVFLTHRQHLVRVARWRLDLIDAHDRRVEAVAQCEDRQQRKENDGSHRNALRELGIHSGLCRLSRREVKNDRAVAGFQRQEICTLCCHQTNEP